MFRFAAPRPTRRPSLTPMIDVVFLLLVFFMLAAQFGRDSALPLGATQGGMTAYSGPPRLVELSGDGLRLNGRAITAEALPDALATLVEMPEDIIVLRPREGAVVQDLVDLMDDLDEAGFARLVVVE